MKDIKPHSLAELAIANSLMRLMSDNGGELPLKIYVKHKTAPNLWYYEMQEAGLNAEEITVLEKYLKGKYGVADSQEVLMQLVMDKKISGFDMKEANRLRKTVAKKNFREIDAVKELFYTKGAEAGTRKVLLDYVWEHCVSLQLGYSFSTIHTTGYSIIAVQEMNLAFFYPRIYWNCACLSVDSSAINDQDFYNLIDEGVIEEDVENEESNNGDAVKRTQNKMNYSKLAAALDKFKKVTTIKLPDINLSRLGFTPNAKENTILYGLKGISRITEPVIKEIIANRPFNSLQDFINKTTSRIVTKDKIINLIKCGAFDSIEHKTRREILNEYLYSQCGAKKRLTLQNANMLIDENLLDNDDATEMYKLTKELRKHRDSQRLWYKGDEIMVPASKRMVWLRLISDSGVKPLSLTVNGDVHKVISSDSWDAVYERYMTQLRTYIKEHHDELLERLNQNLFKHELEKYGGDRNELDWELDSLNFYFSGHPLENIEGSLPYIRLTKVPDLVENATDGFFLIKGVQVPKMKLFTLAGTVLDKDSTKGTVTLQCPSGVVILKMYKDLYALYSQVINNEQGQVIDDTYWQKGEHLLVTGISRGSTFVPKVYKNTPVKSVERIVIDNQYRFIRLQIKSENKA